MFRPPPLPRTLPAALRDLAEEKAAVRADAIRDLIAHGEEHRERVLVALEKAASDPEASVRVEALRALAALGAHEALPTLLVACEDDDLHVRQEAIAGLGDVGDERATGKLSRALRDPRPEVRFQAVMAFPRVCPSRPDVVAALVRATEDADEHVVQVALRMAEEVGASGREEVDEPLVARGDEPSDVVPPELLVRARELLAHPSPRVRVVAAIVVARAGEAGGHATLLGVVDGSVETPEAEDVAEAIALVGRLGLREAERALERRAFGGVLGFGRDAFAWHARTALARLGHARATREILRDLSAGDRARRALAIVAAGEARLAAARAALLGLHASPRGVDVELVTRALAAIGAAPAPAESAP